MTKAGSGNGFFSVKRLFLVPIVCVGSVLAALVGTFLLTPLWRWFEATTGIESIGHSGPADWCFVATWFVLVAAVSGIWLVLRRPSKG